MTFRRRRISDPDRQHAAYKCHVAHPTSTLDETDASRPCEPAYAARAARHGRRDGGKKVGRRQIRTRAGLGRALLPAVRDAQDQAAFAAAVPAFRAAGEGVPDEVGGERGPGRGMRAGRHGDALAQGAPVRSRAGQRGDLDLHHRAQPQDRRAAQASAAPNPRICPGDPRPSRTRPTCWHCSRRASGWAQALARLPEKQRDLIERAYFGDLSHSEIAAETGLPLGTIKSRIRLALERLRHADEVRKRNGDDQAPPDRRTR